MNRHYLMTCTDDELKHALLPFDDQMNNEGIPCSMRAMKGWHLFMTSHELEIPFHDPASHRVMQWFRNHLRTA